jgi:hypothetical protein
MDPLVLAQTGDVFSLFHQLHCGIPERYQPLAGHADPLNRPSSPKKLLGRGARPASSSSNLAEAEPEERNAIESPGRLPAELWEYIFSFLPLQALAATAQTCRFFTRLRWPLVVVDRQGPWLDDAALRTVVSHQPEVRARASAPTPASAC